MSSLRKQQTLNTQQTLGSLKWMLDELQDSAGGEGPFGSVSLVCQQVQQARDSCEVPASESQPDLVSCALYLQLKPEHALPQSYRCLGWACYICRTTSSRLLWSESLALLGSTLAHLIGHNLWIQMLQLLSPTSGASHCHMS